MGDACLRPLTSDLEPRTTNLKMKKLPILLALVLAAGCTTPTQYIRQGVQTPNAAGIVDQDVRAAVSELGHPVTLDVLSQDAPSPLYEF